MLLLMFKFQFLSAWVWYNLYTISLFLPVISIRFVAKLLKERCLVCVISHIPLKWFMIENVKGSCHHDNHLFD